MTAEESRSIPQLLERLVKLEDESAVRRIAASYFEICDRLTPETDLDKLGALFAEDAVWRGTGNRSQNAYGAHVGRAAIVGMLAHYCRPQPHFALNAHYLTRESIVAEGAAARGNWLMLQISTYRTGASDLRSAQIEIDFVKRDGHWSIACFTTENLFSREMDYWDKALPPQVPAS
jgi:hypothetical protein